MKIYVGSDHAGFRLKTKLVDHLRAGGHDVVDLGTTDTTSTDYPAYAAKVARAVRDDTSARGLLVCGSGIGVSIAANKVRGIRAVDAWDVQAARISRAHNDTNVLCLGERHLEEPAALAITDTWLSTPFEGGRHQRRVSQIAGIEEEELGGTDPRGGSAR